MAVLENGLMVNVDGEDRKAIKYYHNSLDDLTDNSYVSLEYYLMNAWERVGINSIFVLIFNFSF